REVLDPGEPPPPPPEQPSPAAPSQPPPKAPTPPPAQVPSRAAVPVQKLSLAERVNRAIDRGLAVLRKHAAEVDLPQRYEGLLGWTLLECGASAPDPVIVRLAQSLRAQAPKLNRTYELSTAIFFFDRLRRWQDDRLIQTFAERLVAGQNDAGAWSYTCP